MHIYRARCRFHTMILDFGCLKFAGYYYNRDSTQKHGGYTLTSYSITDDRIRSRTNVR